MAVIISIRFDISMNLSFGIEDAIGVRVVNCLLVYLFILYLTSTK